MGIAAAAVKTVLTLGLFFKEITKKMLHHIQPTQLFSNITLHSKENVKIIHRSMISMT